MKGELVDTAVLVIVIAAVLLAIILIAMAVIARGRNGWLTNRRRAAASDARDEAAEMDRTARAHDAQADEVEVRAQRDRIAAEQRDEAADRLRNDARTEGESAAERERRADEIDPEIDERPRDRGGTEPPRGW